MCYLKQALLPKSRADADAERAAVVDLSREGLRFRTGKDLKVGQTLSLTLRVDKASRAVKLEGKVVWVGPKDTQARSFVGVQFTDYKGHAWKVLREFDKG